MIISKTDLFSIAIFCALTVCSLHSANAEPVLVGGFCGTSSTPLQSPLMGDVTVTLTSPTVGGVPTDGYSQINTTLWGSTDLDVDALVIDAGDNLRKAVIQEGTLTPWTLVLQVTNNGSSDLLLDKIHWLSKNDIADQGPNAGTLTYTAGDLSDSTGANTGFSIPNGTNNPNDIDLSTFLTDTTLASGESATFTWAHGAPVNPSGNTSVRLDNFAISGEFSGATNIVGGTLIYGR